MLRIKIGFIFIISFFIGQMALLASSSIDVSSLKDGPYIGKDIYLLESDKSFTFEEALAKSDSFTRSSTEAPSFGVTRSVYWIKFTLENPTEKPLALTLEQEWVQFRQIDFYQSTNGNWSKESRGYEAGYLHDHTRIHFDFVLEARQTQTYYLRMENNLSPMNILFRLWDRQEFDDYKASKWVDVGLFNGVLAGIFIYNVYLFFATRQWVFLYYVLFIFTVSIYQNSYIGFGQKELWFGNDFMQENAFMFFVLVAISLALPFSYHYLEIKKYAAKLTRGFLFLGGIYALLFVLYFTESVIGRELLFPLFAIGFLFLLISGILVSRKGYKPAYYFTVSKFVYFLGVILVGLRQAGILPANFLGDWIGIIEVFAELLILSFGLSVRISLLREEKEKAQQALINEQQERQQILEETVDKRTKELQLALENEQVLLQELHHRVKNNMQFIMSLYALKLQDKADAEIEEKLKDIESKIQSMSYVHEMLYAQKNIAQIDTQEYFNKLVETVKAAYQTNNIVFDLQVKTALESHQAIYCGIIVNELVINAIKHAFGGKDGEIGIVLKEKDGEKILEIKDNGEGIPENSKDSFGLLMVKTLAEKQLGGSVQRMNDHGVYWKITF